MVIMVKISMPLEAKKNSRKNCSIKRHLEYTKKHKLDFLNFKLDYHLLGKVRLR